jgi:hypothetical protein
MKTRSHQHGIKRGSSSGRTEFAEYRVTRFAPVVDIIVAGQTGRIRVLLEYPSNQCLYIRLSLRPEPSESFVNSLTHNIG